MTLPTPFAATDLNDIPWPVIAALAAGLVVFGILLLIVKRYKRCPSNRVLVIFGMAPGLALAPVDTATVPLLARIIRP